MLVNTSVPATKYHFPAADIERVLSEYRAILENGRFLSQGDHVARFETAFASAHGVKHAAAVNSGTAALTTILRALKVEGRDVVVPTNTFAATAFAVLHAGARPIFADIGDDLCLDPRDLARRITPTTAAVITVHIGGHISAQIREIQEVCRQRGIPLVEDAAHAQGSTFEGRHAGTFGVAAAFSFFSTKVLTTGEGGMVATNDPAIDAMVRVLRDQAKVANRNLHEHVGFNWRMNEFQAILGNVQLARLPEFLERRRHVADLYQRELEGIRGLDWLRLPSSSRSNYYKVVAYVAPDARDRLRERLKKEHAVSLAGEVYDRPLHQQPVFAPYTNGTLPRADDLCARHICPPIYSQMTDGEADQVVAGVRACLH